MTIGLPAAGLMVRAYVPYIAATDERGADENNIARFGVPNGAAADDRVVVVMHTENSTLTTPPGWTREEYNPDIASRQFYIFSKIITAGEVGTTVSCTHVNGTRRYSSCSVAVRDHSGNIDTIDTSTSGSTANVPSNTAGGADDSHMVCIGMVGSNRNVTSFPNDLPNGNRSNDAAGNQDSSTGCAGVSFFGNSRNPGSFGMNGSTGTHGIANILVW